MREVRAEWLRVDVEGPVNGVAAATGWVKVDFVQPAVLPVDGIGQPVGG